MPVNDIITQAEYNNIRNKVIGVLGTGSGNSGYGQPLNSTAVALGNRVTINEYANLRFDIINAVVHQAGAAPTTVTVAAGNTVRFSAVDSPITTYDTLADALVANRFLLGAGQSAVAVPAGSPVSRNYTGVGGDVWNVSLSCTIQFNWPNANAARHFFNSGGQIRIASTRSGGSLGTTQATTWTSILSSAGTQSFGGNSPATNWFTLTNSFQQYYSLAGSSPYGSNSYALQARVVDVANNSTGGAASAEIRVVFTDGYNDPDPAGAPQFAPVDAVDGNFSIATSLLFATGVLVPSGFGNFSVTQPAVTFGSILSSGEAPAAPAAAVVTSISANGATGDTVSFGSSQSSGYSFSTTFRVNCAQGSGTISVSAIGFAGSASASVSPSSFAISAGQSQVVTLSGSVGPGSVTNPWTWTATVSGGSGGSFTYVVHRGI